MIAEFLRFTGIHPETFGRLTVNDPDVYYKLRKGNFRLHDWARDRIISFIQNYEDLKS